MECPKCKGRMFPEKYYYFVRSFDAWKCSCCGELLDTTILENRARNLNSLLGTAPSLDPDGCYISNSGKHSLHLHQGLAD